MMARTQAATKTRRRTTTAEPVTQPRCVCNQLKHCELHGAPFGGSPDYEGAVYICSLREGTVCRTILSKQIMTVSYHCAGSTAVSMSKAYQIRTRAGDERDVEADYTHRVARHTVVQVLSIEEAKKIHESAVEERRAASRARRETPSLEDGPRGTDPIPAKPIRTAKLYSVGGKVKDDVVPAGMTESPKVMVERLVAENKLKYREIQAAVAVAFPGWDRSVSWCSNIAFYMRKDGRMPK